MRPAVFALIAAASCCCRVNAAPPENFTLQMPGGGAFEFRNVLLSGYFELAKKQIPYFEANVQNSTGREWIDAIFGVKVSNSDGTSYQFSVQLPYGLRPQDTVEAMKIFGSDEHDASKIASYEIFLQRGLAVEDVLAQVYEGPLIDEDCVKDYLDALALSGLARRERIAKMSVLGCIHESAGTCKANTRETKIFRRGTSKNVFSLVLLTGCSGPESDAGGSGWVPQGEIRPGTIRVKKSYP